ncbi:phosphatase 2C-like domain-containing protein [Cladochytrium replicatum]|nr:phosphatase 2C-like domain-containing protein [Cladochytrium replicatum]
MSSAQGFSNIVSSPEQTPVTASLVSFVPGGVHASSTADIPKTVLDDLDEPMSIAGDRWNRQPRKKADGKGAHTDGHGHAHRRDADGGASNTNSETEDAGFRIGFAEDRNRRYRRTMEDAHSFFYNFDDKPGQGWFAIFDGHAGKAAAAYAGGNVHKNFQSLLNDNPDSPVPHSLNKAFVMTDTQLGQNEQSHSGCTAIVAYVRREERALDNDDETKSTSTGKSSYPRVLYTANVGDARAVLSRDGRAIRLSYDHKGSDPSEARRITEAGGFVMNNRVNGVLAVTRSLGDMSMKEWIIGNPYTTETVLNDQDGLLILACDGIWDVCGDQQAVDYIKDIDDPQEAADSLLNFALTNGSTDNLSVLVVRFKPIGVNKPA